MCSNSENTLTAYYIYIYIYIYILHFTASWRINWKFLPSSLRPASIRMKLINGKTCYKFL